ncbi:MAG: S8 family serine peptidase, partial [Dehalococcoidia bacterium]|nr:S8 family serine peptidase [Dehalococcoidia bacterium]
MSLARKCSRLAIVLLLIAGLMGIALPAGATGHSGVALPSDRLIVQFEPGTPPGIMALVHQRTGGRVEAVIPAIGAQVVTVPGGQGLNRAAVYRWHMEVLSAEPDSIACTADAPNDPYFGAQWALSKVQGPDAWTVTTGSRDIVIAILDTGIDSKHPDLAGKIVASVNFTDSPTADYNGHNHGTHVAGVAAAVTNNGIGVAGMGYDSSLMNVKVLGDSGIGYYSWISQ